MMGTVQEILRSAQSRDEKNAQNQNKKWYKDSKFESNFESREFHHGRLSVMKLTRPMSRAVAAKTPNGKVPGLMCVRWSVLLLAGPSHYSPWPFRS
jgi:hypothetical protein